MSFESIIKENEYWIENTWKKLDRKLSRTAVKSRNKIPYTVKDGIHDDKKDNITWWTNGFWGGLMWLMYEATKNPEYATTAKTSERLLEKGFDEIDGLHHDVGFMWHLTSGANYRLTGDRKARLRNLYAASTLASRYNVRGDYIQAWNGEAQFGYSIIDCLMNLPLLYWASDELEVPRFRDIAIRHMDMALRDHIRPDGSTNHIVDHFRDCPGVKEILGGQGYSATSCWSRGLAWAVYGSVLAYIHVGDDRYLEAARRTADYFLERVAKTGGAVVSCGGGAVLRPENVELMKQSGKIIFLSATPETIYERVKHSTNRPLLNGNMNVEYIRGLMERRRETYENAADVVISTDGKWKSQIVEEILG